ncbi:imidazole glycerol phosphate synthase subunit HisH [Campylobacter jejuni]
MQLFLERGYEGGVCEGLGFIEGEVVKFEEDLNLKIPHMGWNELEILKQDPLYQGINNKSDFYFVHSFYVKCKDEFVSAKAQYGHNLLHLYKKIVSLRRNFTPKKSNLGLKLLENFARL